MTNMTESTRRVAELKHKIAIAVRHNKIYSCDLISLEDARTETKKLIQVNNNFIRVSNKELQALKDQQFLRYLHTPCYRYSVNG